MIPIFCFRCSKKSISIEGLRCFHCDNDESRRTDNFHPPVPESGNVSPGYYVPAADASTQRVEEDFIPFEPTREASAQTTDSDFNLLEQTVGICGDEKSTRNGDSSQVKTLQDSEQDCNANQKLILANPSAKDDDFHNLPDNDSCDPITTGPLLENMEVLHAERTYLFDQYSLVEYKNNPHFDSMPRKQENIEPIVQVDEASKLDFAGSSLFLSENPMKTYTSNSFNNLNMKDGQEKVNMPPVLPCFSQRSSSSTSKRFPENLKTEKSATEQIRTSRNLPKKNLFARCKKCGSGFYNQSAFIAHIQNNCDMKPFKCDECNTKFRYERELINHHQRVHSGEKPFKCTLCDYDTAYKSNLNKHMKDTHQ